MKYTTGIAVQLHCTRHTLLESRETQKLSIRDANIVLRIFRNGNSSRYEIRAVALPHASCSLDFFVAFGEMECAQVESASTPLHILLFVISILSFGVVCRRLPPIVKLSCAKMIIICTTGCATCADCSLFLPDFPLPNSWSFSTHHPHGF